MERLRFEIGARATGAPGTGSGHGARTGRDAGVYPAGDQGDRARAGWSLARWLSMGYEMVLGNTYHPSVSPGPDRIAAALRPAWVHGVGVGFDHRFGRVSGVPGWRMGGWRRGGGEGMALVGIHGSVVSIGEEGVRFRSDKDGRSGCSSRRRSRWRCRRSWGPTSPWSSTSAPRTTPIASTPPARAAHAPLARSLLDWHARRTGAAGRVRDRPGRRPRGPPPRVRRAVSAAGVDGIAIGGTLGRDKEEMRGVLEMTRRSAERGAQAPARDRRRGGPAGRHRPGLDVFDCAIPTRLARHGTALVPDPDNRFRLDLRKAAGRATAAR